MHTVFAKLGKLLGIVRWVRGDVGGTVIHWLQVSVQYLGLLLLVAAFKRVVDA